MPKRLLSIAFFGSSLVSAYWNGAATYYRGLISSLHRRGHRITFFEPDAYDRQAHRDIPDPPYARSVVYPANSEQDVLSTLKESRHADVIIKTSGVGVFDQLLEEAVLSLKTPENAVIFWDVDAPATLDRIQRDADDPFRRLLSGYDLILTYGGGEPVVNTYCKLGARDCVPVYNALDPQLHFRVGPDHRFNALLGFMGNRMPDREMRVKEFFFAPAKQLREHRFLLGGNGWAADTADLSNITYVGHVYTRDHNAFNCTPHAVLNINRESMARNGFSPPTRIFEAAGAAACLIIDDWKGIDRFLEPNRECLTAKNAREVIEHLQTLTPEKARDIGRAAQSRVLGSHTYDRRAVQVETIFYDLLL
ncbi:MAG: glycosyltransferase [Desulfobacterales bacterium]